MRTFTQDPGERLDYVFDYTKRMAKDGDTISESTFVVPDTITLDGNSMQSTTTRIWLKNPDSGSHRITNEIVTVGGRIYRRSITINVRNL